METLNDQATKIFCTLMNHQREGYLKIENEPFMPLTLERISDTILTPYGQADTYSLFHYGEQNGDLMFDPEMCFLVIDQRGMDTGATEEIAICAFSYRNDYLWHHEQSVFFENGQVVGVKAPLQKEQTEFANGWLLNIQGQGFLDKISAP